MKLGNEVPNIFTKLLIIVVFVAVGTAANTSHSNPANGVTSNSDLRIAQHKFTLDYLRTELRKIGHEYSSVCVTTQTIHTPDDLIDDWSAEVVAVLRNEDYGVQIFSNEECAFELSIEKRYKERFRGSFVFSSCDQQGCAVRTKVGPFWLECGYGLRRTSFEKLIDGYVFEVSDGLVEEPLFSVHAKLNREN